jgi:hypothetical protein
MTFKETLHKKLFWDSDFEKLDLDLHKKYVVERVLERAPEWITFKKMIEYYGREHLINIIKDLYYLDDRTISFCENYFEIPKEEMRCYIRKQSMPKHWH